MATLANAQDVTREDLIEAYAAVQELLERYEILHIVPGKLEELTDERVMLSGPGGEEIGFPAYPDLDIAGEIAGLLEKLSDALVDVSRFNTDAILAAVRAPHGMACVRLSDELSESYFELAIEQPKRVYSTLYSMAQTELRQATFWSKLKSAPGQRAGGPDEAEPSPSSRDIARQWLEYCHLSSPIEVLTGSKDWQSWPELMLLLKKEQRAAIALLPPTKTTASATKAATAPTDKKEFWKLFQQFSNLVRSKHVPGESPKLAVILAKEIDNNLIFKGLFVDKQGERLEQEAARKKFVNWETNLKKWLARQPI